MIPPLGVGGGGRGRGGMRGGHMGRTDFGKYTILMIVNIERIRILLKTEIAFERTALLTIRQVINVGTKPNLLAVLAFDYFCSYY